MSDTLLRSLRSRLLDESEPLAGLLRKCLLLGAETGSSALREWARNELNGYGDYAQVPAFRRVPVPVIKMNSISGYNVVTGQALTRFELPTQAEKLLPEEIELRQPVEELETIASSPTYSFTSGSLAHAQALWNQELSEFQQVTALYFEMSGAVLSGVLGKIRTQLLDVVADLTADTPLAEVPGKEQVDAAVGQHIGTQYVTTIHAVHGPTAIGSNARSSSDGFSIDDVVRLLDAVREGAGEVGDEQIRSELLEALEDLRAEVRSAAPDTGAIVKKAGRLRAAAANIGLPAISAAVGGAVEALTSLAVGGAFG
ncbi:AbiTii domain-containing protein [Agromyces silvae]|uniref:AbiTii domain-containing protein n=1 Tax=Agromyces silvae TaxID=3388266 RepID=UPI00280B7E7C|nr:hypothetical protein [Agromyces protaetiae]